MERVFHPSFGEWFLWKSISRLGFPTKQKNLANCPFFSISFLSIIPNQTLSKSSEVNYFYYLNYFILFRLIIMPFLT